MQYVDRKHRTTAYSRDMAVGYDQKRARQATWHRENAIVRRWSQTVPAGSRVLDIPCGTGRLFPIFFDRGIRVVGADLSDEMMQEIPTSVRNSPLLESLERRDASDLPYADQHFDYVVSLRLFHLCDLPKRVQVKMLGEFMRVAKAGVVLHLPLSGRSFASRVADTLWRASPRREGPVHFMRLALARMRGTTKRRPTIAQNGAGTPRAARWAGAVWSQPELTDAFREGGFKLVGAYGAISPWSAKKICVAVRVGDVAAGGAR
jgi:ubiquinone/menaquinone biosynthesis C-methylase UbiE